MRMWLLTTVLSIFTIASITPVFFLVTPKKVEAQIAAVPTSEMVLSPLNINAGSIVLNTGVTNGLIGLPGTTQTIMTTIRETLGTVCTGILRSLDSGQTVQSLVETTATSALSVLGGGDLDAGKLSKKIVRAATAKECADNYVLALSKFSPPTVLVGQDLQREQDKFTKVSESLRKIIEDLQARQNASVKDIMRAFMVKLVLNLNKNLTTKVVNSLLQEYKINDYLAYGDALATQVYAMKYIDQNYKGDARTQLMMRSLIQSEKAPEKARVAAAFANQQAKEYITSACGSVGQLDASNSSSLNCLAAYGNEQASPMFKYLNALDTSAQIKTQANKTAQAEISQSNGYAPPRDCSGSLADQKRIDAASDQAANEVVAAANVLAKLQEALAAGKTTQAEVDKAQAAFDAADKKMSALVSKDVESPVIDICKAIDSPAAYVGNSIQKLLDQHLDQGSQLKSDNLPFYATFLADITGNFLTNLLTGGKKSSKILKEGGLAALGIAVGGATSQIPTGTGTGTGGGAGTVGNVTITARGANGQAATSFVPGQAYTITVNFTSIKNQNPTEVEIAGTEATPIRRVVFGEEFNAGQLTINYTATSQPLNLSVSFYKRYDSVSTLLIDIYSKDFPVAGTVNGASTTNFNPRGAVVATFRPR